MFYNQRGRRKGCCKQQFIPAMADISANSVVESSISPLHAKFLAENPEVGFVKIQASRGQQAIPTQDVRVVITKNFDGEIVNFYQGTTDENGIINNIPLPAPPRELSLDSEKAPRGAQYQLLATHPKYSPQRYSIEVFEGVRAILPITLQLK